MRCLFLLTMAALTLSGCAAPVLMKNPANGQIAQCYSPTDVIRRWSERDACVRSYESQGWVRAESGPT